PSDSFNGAISYVSFELNPDTRTLDARVAVDNKDGKLKPGMFATVTVRIPVVPTSSQPSTAPIPDKAPFALAAAMVPYTKASQMLARGSTENVWANLKATIDALSEVPSPNVHKMQ